MITLSIIMMLGSLWTGSYFYKYVDKTWADLPYITTFICIGIGGFCVFVNSLLP